MEGHAKTAPISRLPLITMLDVKHHLKDIPVCQVGHYDHIVVLLFPLLFLNNRFVFLAAISLGA